MSTLTQNYPAPISAAQWAKMATKVDFWSFAAAKLSLRLYLEQLRQSNLQDGGVDPTDDKYLESLACVLSEGKLSSSGTSLMAELVRGAEPSLPDKVRLLLDMYAISYTHDLDCPAWPGATVFEFHLNRIR